MRALVLVLLLVACARPQPTPLSTRLAGFLGQPEAAVLGQFGAPGRIEAEAGQRFLIYQDRSITYYPGYVGQERVYARYGSTFPRPPWRVESICQVTFTVTAGVVTRVATAGEGCG